MQVLEHLRVLLIGGSGQLGHALEAACADSREFLATACLHPERGHVRLDLGDRRATTELLTAWRPDVVLLAGAMCHVDRCEQEANLCRRINVDGPVAVAEFARAHGSRVVFFSTDHVFDGTQPCYVESDAARPLSAYARSKLDAEAAIREIIPDRHLIVRTGWVYGPDVHRRNFILRLIDRLRGGEIVEVPEDQSGNPTYTADLAAAVRFLIERAQAGTFHATGPDVIDRVSLARRVCDRFDLDAGLVVPRPTSALGQAAQRSLRVVLDCGRLRGIGAPEFMGVAAGLDSLAAWSASVDLCQEAS